MLAKQVIYHLSHNSSPFSSGYLEMEVSETICLGWSQALALLVSASQVARITGMNHECLVIIIFYKYRLVVFICLFLR
jgi:hypothetical protein